MDEIKPPSQMRRRRSSGNPNLPLNLELGFKVTDTSAAPSGLTPSPSCANANTGIADSENACALMNFKDKQQSFDIQYFKQIEECEEEEIDLESGDEDEEPMSINRAITPTPIHDFGASIVYSESAPSGDFLSVTAAQNESITDVSEAESETEE